MKAVNKLVWPVSNYTDKISTGIKFTFCSSPHLAFTCEQIGQSLKRGFPWLVEETMQQKQLLAKLIKLYTKRLVQLGLVKEVKSCVTVDQQWMWAEQAAESSYTDITSYDAVAHTPAALKGVQVHPVSSRTMFRLNHITK